MERKGIDFDRNPLSLKASSAASMVSTPTGTPILFTQAQNHRWQLPGDTGWRMSDGNEPTSPTARSLIQIVRIRRRQIAPQSVGGVVPRCGVLGRVVIGPKSI